jgi:hypothetical protein
MRCSIVCGRRIGKQRTRVITDEDNPRIYCTRCAVEDGRHVQALLYPDYPIVSHDRFDHPHGHVARAAVRQNDCVASGYSHPGDDAFLVSELGASDGTE